MPPHFHTTPAEAVRDTVQEVVRIADRCFRIERPAAPDRLFDHPWVRSVSAAHDYTPYWTTLWPSARMLAKVVLRELWPPTPRPLHVLEVGCGLGLAGLACLARGLDVTFSDVDATALAFAARNARLNGFASGFRTCLLDFRVPPANTQYPVVIGSDLLYEDRLVDPLVGLLRAVLAPGGLGLITDPDRLAARRFRWKLEEVGFAVTTEFVRAGEPGGGRTKGTLYRIRHA